MINDKPVTTPDTTKYYRADDYHGNKFYVVKSQSWTEYQTIIAHCPTDKYADEIVEALNAKQN